MTTAVPERAPAHLGAYLRQAGPITWDPDALAASRLDADLCRMLHVVARLEDDTAISARQGRALGVDRAPDVAVFLPSWAQEEAEHARALRFLLAHQRYELPEPGPLAIPLRRRLVARLPVAALRVAPQPALVFLALGAAAEYVTIVVYRELARAVDDQRVAGLLHEITRQEGRHFAFFLAGARARADAMSAGSARVARRVLTSVWEPPGVPSLGLPTWRSVFAPLVDDERVRARVARMDRVLDTIPHLENLGLMRGFLQANPPRGGEERTPLAAATPCPTVHAP